MNWYGNSITETSTHTGYGVWEIPLDPDQPNRLLLRVGNVPFDTETDAQNYLKTLLHPRPQALYTIAHIIETTP